MTEKVVHIPEEIHTRARVFCKAHGLHMKAWVSKLILDAAAAGKAAQALPVRKKKLEQTTGGEDGSKPWEQPPFWAGRGPADKAQEEKQRKDRLEGDGGGTSEGDGETRD